MEMVNGWKERQLSLGGKEILLKLVVHAIPSYAMSFFKIPKQVCKGISDSMMHYWWGAETNKR